MADPLANYIMGLNWLADMYMLNGLMVNKFSRYTRWCWHSQHSDNEYVQEEEEVTDDDGREDGDSDGDDDDMDDQD